MHTGPAEPTLPLARWRLRLLGSLEAQAGTAGAGAPRLDHFPSRAVALLLARLALAPGRAHAREELVELLWPGVPLDVGRNRLRQTLSTLKSLLEPAGSAAGAVLRADRLHIRVQPGALDTDVSRFEALARAGQAQAARALYGGDLLPGFYDEWVVEERRRLALLHERLPEPDLPDAAPPLQAAPAAQPEPLQAAAPRLPSYLTRLFGAGPVTERLCALVPAHRLVTLLGPGGSGKTRLAVEAAAALRGVPGRFDTVAFVPLVTCTTALQVADAVAGALRLPAAAAGDESPLAERLVGALGERRALLVLDNMEQLAGRAGPLLADWLALLPGLHLLVTSRHALDIDGERCLQVEPLALPAPGDGMAELAGNPAVALFADRARAARADFHLGPRNQADIVALVAALQGMPLAIELAAARIRSYSPREMRERLQAPAAPATHAPSPATPGLDLLARSGPRAGLDARHASMQHTIEWSWQLLSAPEQDLLCGLTLFRGGFTAASVRALGGPPLQAALDALVAHSLVGQRPLPAAGGDARFHLYEPIREFAAARLDAAAAARWRAAHRRAMAAWAQALPVTPDLAEVRAERANLQAAMDSAVADGVADEAVHLLLQLRRVLEDVELPPSALQAAVAAVAACSQPVLKSRGQSLLGPLLLLAGRGADAIAAAESGLAALQALAPLPQEPLLHARALHALARARWRSTRDPAQTLPLLDAAQPLARQHGDAELLAGLSALRAFVLNRDPARRPEAFALHQAALQLWQQQGNRHAVHSGQYNLAVSLQLVHRNAQALELLAQLSASARELQDWRRLSQAANVAGNALADLRRWAEARVQFRQGLQLGWQSLAPYEMAFPLWNLPRVLAHLREPLPAVQLAAFAARYWERRFGQLTRSDRRDLLRVRRLALRQLDAAALDAAWAQGEQLELPAAVALALGTAAAPAPRESA